MGGLQRCLADPRSTDALGVAQIWGAMNKFPRYSLEQKPGSYEVFTLPAPDFTTGSTDPDSAFIP